MMEALVVLTLALLGHEATTIVTPEYARELDRVLVSVPMRLDADTPALRNELYWLYRELHLALPAYSEMLVAVLPEDRDVTLKLLEEQARSRRTTLHVLARESTELDHWAQDLGEPVVLGGERKFLVSMLIEGSSEANRALSRFRVAESRQLFGDDVIEADFVFEGGNLAFDRDDAGLLVLVGHNDVELTLASDPSLTRGEVRERISRRFGGARVVEMGVERQSPYIRHLDQAFVLLGSRVAVANTIESTELPAESRQLAHYRRQLEELGYRVEVLVNDAEDIRSFRNSINAVPFTDRTTGRRSILFPVFPGEVKPGHDGRLDYESLSGKARRAFDLYRSLGYEPRAVRDFAFVAGGNTHCVTNVLW